jgi:hypothetical protein
LPLLGFPSITTLAWRSDETRAVYFEETRLAKAGEIAVTVMFWTMKLPLNVDEIPSKG